MTPTPHLWRIYLAAAGVAGTAYMLAPAPLHSGAMFNLIGASAVVAILVGTRLNRPSRRLPWYLLALGQALFVSGDVIAYNWTRFFGSALPYPSAADALYLSVYPALLAGLLILVHARSPTRDGASLLDSLIVATGAGVLSWVLLISPKAHDETLTLATKLISIAYPVADLLLLGIVVRLAVGAGRRGVAFGLLLGGAGALLVTDACFGYKLLHGGYETGGILDPGWIVFYAMLGAAALHPSMGTLSQPVDESVSSLTRGRLALLAGASLVVPAVLLGRLVGGHDDDALVVAGASVVMFALVVARMAGLVQLNEQTTRRERALRKTGEMLVAATGREAIYRAALDGARALAPQASGCCLYVATPAGGDLKLVAHDGDDGRGPPLEHLRVTRLSAELRASLANGRGGALDHAHPLLRRRGAAARRGEVGSAWAAGLHMRQELRGLLVATSERPLPRPAVEALDALAIDVALALESVALTEDLLRRESEARFGVLFQHSSDIVSVLRPDATIMYVSPSVERLVGHAPSELDGSRFSALVHHDDRARVHAFLAGLARQPANQSSVCEFRMGHRDGAWLHVETLGTNLLDHAHVGGIVLNSRDVSERKAFEEQLTHQAFHDTLTGLPNRALFRDRVEHALERQARGGRGVAILFIDVDDFKAINDSLGHVVGDALLRAVAGRLQACVRSGDTAARLSGDEFAVLVEDVGDELWIADVAERLIAALSAPYPMRDHEVYAPVSVGIAVSEAGTRGAVAEELLRNADIAMYSAKERGKGRYQVFDATMQAAAVERLALKADLRRAIAGREFVLHYQPIVALQSSRIVGVEALVRWQHPELGLISPGRFIPLAEDSGLIGPIGRIVLEQACAEAVRLQSLWPLETPLEVSVNLSGHQLQRADIATEVADVLRASGLEPERLTIEITESVLMTDIGLAIRRLQELKALGVRLAIDDFGTGYSSLNYVRQFPFDILKIDRSFIDDLTAGGEVSALTAAIIDLAGILELAPVAEGIETPEQLARLRELHCEMGQGYLLHRPLEHDELELVMAAQASSVRLDEDVSPTFG